MSKKPPAVVMIAVERIHILNPRVRNKKVFESITHNITQVGLKRPITVTASTEKTGYYDLVCGQGRLEAFIACGQKEIPAIVIQASQEQALIMSLVENVARRQYRTMDLMQGVQILRKQGYDVKTIAGKVGLTTEYIYEIIHLLDHGEERLLVAVEAGHIPMSVAAKIAEAENSDVQAVLQEAYETKQLRGQKLLMVKRLIEKRRKQGKTFHTGAARVTHGGGKISVQDVLKIYQREVDRKQLLKRKADRASEQMMFVTQALRQLLREDHFLTLLRAEGLAKMPKQLSQLLNQEEADA